MKNKYSFWELISLITKWRKVYILNFLIVAIISIIISLLLPKWYKASAIVLPPTEENLTSGFASLLNALPLGGMGIGSGSGSQMTYMAILKSETLKRDVIKRFDLQEFYGTGTMYETLIAFDGDYDVQLTEENMIMITYEYQDSVIVADIVNYIVKKLGEISTTLALERAKNTKDFIEVRYFQNLKDIDSLSNEMKEFQSKYGILELDEQVKMIISAIVDLEAKIFMKKTELAIIEQNFGDFSPQYKVAKTNLVALQEELESLKNGTGDNKKNPFGTLFLSLKSLPELTQKYAKLYSDLLLQRKLQEFLLPEYEQAKLQLLKKKPTLQVIDAAIPPDRKSKPKRAFIVLGAIFIAMLINFVIMLFFEHLNWLKINEPENYKQLLYIKKLWLRPFQKN